LTDSPPVARRSRSIREIPAPDGGAGRSSNAHPRSQSPVNQLPAEEGPAGSWKLATGNWQLATGYWLLATGYWQLATGNWLLVTGNCLLIYLSRMFAHICITATITTGIRTTRIPGVGGVCAAGS
jgi:hypothetical protein